MFKRLQKLLADSKSHDTYEVAGAGARDRICDSSRAQPFRCGNSHRDTTTCDMYEVTSARDRIRDGSRVQNYQMRRILISDSDSSGVTARGPGRALADVTKPQSCDHPGKRLHQTELKAGANQNPYYMTSL